LKQSANENDDDDDDNDDDDERKTMCKGAAVAYIKGTLPSFG
jgi:hypothetical protein